MRFIGIDLAWGDRNRTGLAEVDGTGRLLRSTLVRSDYEISEFLSPSKDYSGIVAAIDAPIIVKNPTGQRPCENQVSRLFSKFHAAPHPSNLSRPHFQPEPRAMRLARRFDWAIASTPPADDDKSYAVEVYPHPAMVSLFGLRTVIPYKRGRGRSVEMRLEAFTQLLTEMELHLDGAMQLKTNARWLHICSAVASAGRHVDLNNVEDEIDAIFCAYLAWRWGTKPDSLQVFGDDATGFIVTLPPPQC